MSLQTVGIYKESEVWGLQSSILVMEDSNEAKLLDAKKSYHPKTAMDPKEPSI